MKKIISYIVVLTLLVISGFIYSYQDIKLRSYYLNATFVYGFINSENRRATAVIYLSENGTFQYRERAGRGTTIFIGRYKIFKNVITFMNNNNLTRTFKYNLNKKELILKTNLVLNNNAILFHIQPAVSHTKIKYKRVAYKKIIAKKHNLKTDTYFLNIKNDLYAFVFNPDGTYEFRGVILGKKYSILKGKYKFQFRRLIIEDKKGIKFIFYYKETKQKLILKLLSRKFLMPFSIKNTMLKFKKVR